MSVVCVSVACVPVVCVCVCVDVCVLVYVHVSVPRVWFYVGVCVSGGVTGAFKIFGSLFSTRCACLAVGVRFGASYIASFLNLVL